MTQTANILLTIRRFYGLPKISRYLDAGDWVSDGYFAVKKSFEPDKYQKIRFTEELSNKVESFKKMVKDYEAKSLDLLELPTKVDLAVFDKVILRGKANITAVNPKNLAVFVEIKNIKRGLNNLYFRQIKGSGLSPVYVCLNDTLIGLIMPIRLSDEVMQEYKNANN